nr:HAMP domain-containing sensor histidine kinase [Luteibacter yeojuensis]
MRAARDQALEVAAAKDRFVVVAAHELRQPLAAMMMQADLIRRLGTQRDDETLRELGDEIRAMVRRQARLVGDLLDVSRARVGKLRLEVQPLDLGALVTRVARAMAKTVPSVRLRLDIAPAGALPFCADSVRIEQIVSNLMENALKFAGVHGVVEVSVAADAGFARITVADNGRGIAPEAVEGLFELFGQEEDRPEVPGSACAGLGIGLALVSELASAHGGRVRAYSEGVGKGAAFSVWLPLAPARYVQAYETTTCLDRPAPHSQGRRSCSTSSCRPPLKATATTGMSGALVT